MLSVKHKRCVNVDYPIKKAALDRKKVIGVWGKPGSKTGYSPKTLECRQLKHPVTSHNLDLPR